MPARSLQPRSVDDCSSVSVNSLVLIPTAHYSNKYRACTPQISQAAHFSSILKISGFSLQLPSYIYVGNPHPSVYYV